MEGGSIREHLEGLRIDRSRGEAPAGRRRWPWLLVALALLGAGTWGGLAWLRHGRPVAVRTITVQEAPAGRTAGAVLNASGYVTARRRATVSAKITGKLVQVLVEEGMPVSEDQVLARLDDAQFRANLDLARSRWAVARRTVEETGVRLKLARVTLERTQRLAAEGVTGQAALDEAETAAEALEARLAVEQEQVGVAESEVSLRRTELDDAIVRAPFDGIVISKDAQAGEMVSPMSAGGGFTRTGICTLVDMTSLEIEVDVNEAYISRVRPDQPVEATLDAYPDWRIPARVITTVPAADRQKATVLVRIAFESLDERILPDMGIKVAFLEAAAAEGSAGGSRIFIPRSALHEDAGRDIVYIVKDDRAERRAVALEEGNGDPVGVLSGLAAGERVVVESTAPLSAGDKVKGRTE